MWTVGDRFRIIDIFSVGYIKQVLSNTSRSKKSLRPWPSWRFILYSTCILSMEKTLFCYKVTRWQRSKHVLVVFTGIISFCVCYYHGPVTSDRGLDLIRWMLQLVGLTLLYMGTRSDVVSFGVISTVFSSHVIRSSGILMGVVKMMPRHWWVGT